VVAARPLVPGKRDADMVGASALHAAVISCCILPVAQRKDLVAEVRRTLFAASCGGSGFLDSGIS
jgi:hypothetical protein